MENGIHFISGLPRSGSTLLAAILRQNPRFHAAMTSPVSTLFLAMQAAMSRKNETSVFLDETQKYQLLKGLFTGTYHATHKDRLVFDSSRAWCSKLPTLAKLFPAAKVLCCVRDVGWIMDSLERLIRENAFELSGIFGFDANTTVYTRVSRLATSDGMVGYALDALREAYYGEEADRLILVSYDALVRAPAETMETIYRLLGEAPFRHDFENLEYDAAEFDLPLGTPNLHRVRRRVEWIERRSVLPPDLFARFANDAFWLRADGNPRNVPVILHRG